MSAWGLFSYNMPLLVALVERAAIILVALPWIISLERTARSCVGQPVSGDAPPEASGNPGVVSPPPAGWKSLLRTVLMLLWLDRLMLDFSFWATVGVLPAGLLAAWQARASAGGAGGRNASPEPGCPQISRSSRVHSPWFWILLTGIAAAAAANLALLWPACFLVTAFVLYSVYFGPRALGASRPDSAALVAWLAASAMLLGSAQGLTHLNVVTLLAGGAAGWVFLKFTYWRERQMFPGGSRLRIGSIASALLAGLMIAVLAAEVYFRTIYDASDANGSLRTSRRWAQRHVMFNSWGYRDREFPEVPTEIPLRVLVLGDSFAFGWGINDYHDLLGPQLERALDRQPLESPRVFTIAIGGINTTHQMELFRRDGVRLSPHVVVLAYHVNDIDPPDARGPIPARWFLTLESVTGSSDFLQFFAWRLHERLEQRRPGDLVVSSLSAYQDEALFSEHSQNVRTLMDDIRAAGAVPVAVLFPFINGPTREGPQRVALDRMDRLLSDYNVRVIDVTRLMNVNERRFHANPFDPHPSPAMHREIVPHLAELVWAALRESLPVAGGANSPS